MVIEVLNSGQSFGGPIGGASLRNALARLWLAEEAVPHGVLVRIPVPVILVSLLFDAPNLIEQTGSETASWKPARTMASDHSENVQKVSRPANNS